MKFLTGVINILCIIIAMIQTYRKASKGIHKNIVKIRFLSYIGPLERESAVYISKSPAKKPRAQRDTKHSHKIKDPGR